MGLRFGRATGLGAPLLEAWAARRPLPSGAGRDTPASIIWTANVVAALLFGAMHLPQAAALHALTPAVVIYVLVGNGIAGVALCWLYWRHELEAAMVGHFATDIVLHAVTPAIFPEP